VATQAVRFDNAGCSWIYPWGGLFDFYFEVKHANPRVRVVFLVGPPTFLSLTWPTEVMAREKEPQQIDLEALATARMM
jgi:hypothetical protein